MKKDFLQIAIIGKPASGKTFLLNKLQEKGYKVLNCDLLVKKYYSFPHPCYFEMKKKLGSQIAKWGKIDKTELKKLIIRENSAKKIEEIIFPYIFKHLSKKAYDFVEIPVLFNKEINFISLFKRVIELEIDEQKREIYFSRRNVDNLTKKTLIIINKEYLYPKNVDNYVEKYKSISEILLNF
ncbi:MAG: dephospho-CoA kinase [Metamycoplasmataceae bacterium]